MRSLCLLIVLNIGSFLCPYAYSQSEVSLDHKIGQMLMVGFRGLEITDQSPVVQDIKERRIGGVILFDYDVPKKSPVRNIASFQQLKRLTEQLQYYSEAPLFIGIDQEGGKIARLKPRFGFPKMVSPEYLGELDNTDTTRYYARKQARLLDSLDINLNFSPVVDLNTNPKNPIIGELGRSFSGTPEIVTRHARIFIEQYLQHDIIPVLKHFPGHGSARNDSHKGIADVTETWSSVELEPYKNLIATGSAPAIMTAHVFNARLDSVYPATLSEPILNDLLRNRLGFNGLVFSDDMQMKAIRSHYGLETAIKKAIQAGVDVLVFANNSIFEEDIAERSHKIIKNLIETGELSVKEIDRSYNRIMKVKKRIH